MRPRVTELTQKKWGGEEVANKRRHYYELSCGCVRGCESVVVSTFTIDLRIAWNPLAQKIHLLGK